MSDTANYERAQIQSVLDAGPQDDETWFRIKVSGKEASKHLNVTTSQLEAIRDLLTIGSFTNYVWVLVIEHRYGTDSSVHRSEDIANDAVAEFVDQWWEQEMPDRPKPTDPKQAVVEYFDRVGESYTLTRAALPT